MVKNPPANAGDAGLILDPRRSHMPWSNQACAPQRLSPRAASTEAQARAREATAMRSPQPQLESSSHSPHLEKKTRSGADPGQLNSINRYVTIVKEIRILSTSLQLILVLLFGPWFSERTCN